MTTAAGAEPQRAAVLGLEVVLAGAAFVAGGVTAAASTGLPSSGTPDPALALLAGWPLMGLTGVIVLDRAPGLLLGRVLALLGLVPLLLVLWPSGRADAGTPPVDRVVDAATNLAGLLAVAACLGVPLAARPAGAAGKAALGLATAGGVLVLLAPSRAGIGWAVAAVGVIAGHAAIARRARTQGRDTRRGTCWLLVVHGAGAATVALSWVLAPTVAPMVLCAALAVAGAASALLVFTTGFRSLAERAVDVAALAAALAVAVGAAVLVAWAAAVAGLPVPRASGAFSGVAALAVAVPAAWWVRRSALARRYGTGTLTPADVALITADLHREADPRDLLGRAARMVAVASGSREARIVLGPLDGPLDAALDAALDAPVDAPVESERGWTAHPLVVGGEGIGHLLVRDGGDEGPEPRQLRVVAQLIPTVGLVARAVGLAVEAEHARRDVARQRDAERTRVLADLHDGLGPVLAGMSMRVGASLRTTDDAAHAETLRALADDLSRGRADLRRLVSGISPSVLDETDLTTALKHLVHSFDRQGAGPRLALQVDLGHHAHRLTRPTEVTVYRCVAEGMTNALRHAGADEVRVDVRVAMREAGAAVEVEVADDGRGGSLVPGVGLTSLRQRAEGLGGTLEAAASPAGGVRLRVSIPAGAA